MAKQQPNIKEMGINDVPQFSNIVKYFDGDVAFADNISSLADLASIIKINFVAIAFCTAGEASATVNGKKHTVRRHDALFIGMNSVVSGIAYTPEFECKIIVVSAQLGLSFLSKSIFDTLLRIQANPVLHFRPEETELMIRYYDLAIFKIEHPELNYGRETLVNLLRNISLDMLTSINRHLGDQSESNMMRQSDKLFQRFIALIASNEKHERSVQWFAEKLCISSKYLTSICGQKTGKTASEIIAASITERIRQRLQYSEKSIKEIAAEMNFDNISFFGKYVKKHLGMSPSTFRKLNHYGE